jgi:hypothetical protein
MSFFCQLKTNMWTFSSRRTGIRYKANEISEYLDWIATDNDDRGDLVLHNVWSSEIRLDYIIHNKLPKELHKLFNHIVAASKARYTNHWFTVLYDVGANSTEKYLLVKFTLEDGKEDCKIKFASVYELEKDDVETARKWFFDFSDPLKDWLARANDAIKHKKARSRRIPASFKSK